MRCTEFFECVYHRKQDYHFVPIYPASVLMSYFPLWVDFIKLRKFGAFFFSQKIFLHILSWESNYIYVRLFDITLQYYYYMLTFFYLLLNLLLSYFIMGHERNPFLHLRYLVWFGKHAWELFF